MGCSPSKGNNFGTQGPFKRGTTLLPVHQEIPGESQSDDGSCGGSSTTGDTDGEPLERSSGEWKLVGQTDSTQKEATSTLQKKKASLSEVVPVCVLLDKVGAQEIDTNKLLQEKAKHGDKQDMADKKSGRKPKKNNKAVKLIKKKEKEQKASIVDQKVDFPEPLVKAHQAAYGFLNPSISKYEILLNLLDQATQTQVSVQPMVAFMAMRYDEINQGLREMAEEGEKLLKENGEHLAWPSLMKNLSSNLSKTGSTNTEPPPDLLQQLLQYTTQRMQSVGQSVGGIGDSALEEAADYFASVSVLLEEKLKAKQAIEARLMQLLTRIEAASIRKPGPDDSALFSEDSGIGAESESLTGSERRLRRESCESTGTIRTCPCSPTVVNRNLTRGQAASWRTCNNQSPRVFRGGIDSGCSVKEKCQKDTESLLASASLDDGEDDEDARGEEDADDVEEGSRKRSNSSPPDPEHVPRRLPSKRIENPQNVEMTLKMKDALSGRIRFASSQHAKTKTMPIESPKTSRRQWVEDEGKSPKRPQTAAPVRKALKKAPVGKEHRSQSEESLRNKAEDPTLLELERTQRDLNQRLAKMSKGKTTGNKTNPTKQNQGNTPQSSISNRLHPSMEKNSNTLPKQNKSGLMKCNTGEQESSKDTENKTKNKKTKAPLKATPPPSPPPSRPPSGLYRGRNSVKKLIDTFSQGMEEPKPESSKVLGPLKGVRKCGVPILPGLGNVEAALSAGLTSCRVDGLDKNEDLDLDNLPPPPLEVLMDNSFEGAQSLSVSDLDDGVLSRGRSLVAKRATVSQRLRASMQSATVLPSKGNMPRGSRSMSPARTIRKPHISTNISQREGIQTGEDLETEEAASLYKQARKVIHLRHSFDSAEKKALPFSLPVKPSLSQSELGDKQDESRPDGSSQSEVVPTFKVINSRPHETSPVLRARVLPTTPSVAGSLHRRLPSPSVFKRQPTPPSSASSPVVRDLPTPPPVQRRLPSPPAVRREMTPNTHSVSASPFKAPSPPASPRFHRFSRGNSNEDPGAISSPRLISNARSVFCPASPSLFEAHSCPVPQPPQAWTATGVSFVTRAWGDRGRFPMSARGPKPFVKRSHSDRRPSLSMPPRAPTISVAQTCGSEPALSLQGLYDEPTRDPELWHSQSDLRGSTRSASHPDLCIVGQALHRE